MNRSKDWLGPLTGVVAVALVAAGVIITGSTPNPSKDSAEKVVSFYTDHETKVSIGAFVFALAGVFLVFFGGWLRKALRAAEGEGGVLSAVAFGGTLIFAVGGAVGATLLLAIADSANDIDPVAVQALNAFNNNYFVPFVVGLMTLQIASGISVIRHGAFPKWLGWVALVVGVLDVSPAGFFLLPVTGLWIIVTSVMMARNLRSAPATT